MVTISNPAASISPFRKEKKMNVAFEPTASKTNTSANTQTSGTPGMVVTDGEGTMPQSTCGQKPTSAALGRQLSVSTGERPWRRRQWT
eukprot:7871014-Pyramimonas_sp.AAC.1